MINKEYPTEPLSMKANMLWNSAGSLVCFGFQWLMTIVVVRISGDYESAGILALAMAVYNIVSPITVYRMYTYQISDLKHENSLGEYLSFRIITVALGMILAAIYTVATCPAGTFVPIMLYLLGKMCSQLLDSFHASMQLNARMDYIGISYALQGAGTFASFCLVFYFTESLSWSFASIIVVTVLIGVLYVYPRGRAFETVKLGIPFSKVKHLFVYCFPIVIATVACAASPSIPRQFLAIAQSESLLGIYASVAAPAAIIQMGATYIYTPLLSTFAGNYVEGNHRGFKNLILKVAMGIAFIGLALGAFLLFFGDVILALLFGQDITEYSYLLLPIVACTMVTAYLWFFNDVLIAVREFKGSFLGNMVSLVATLLITVPLVNAFDANGVSFVTIIAFAFGIAVLVFFLNKAVRSMPSS